MFANPAPGDSPMPPRIASGDLDGDLYLTCWHEPILSHFVLSTFSTADNCANAASDVQTEHSVWNEHWLEQGQQLMGDTESMATMNNLIGTLYKLWEVASERDNGRSVDAVALGRAYKHALDLGKHGGQVYLPARLWYKVPPRFHSFPT
jgi:RNA dependent RNA polymerase